MRIIESFWFGARGRTELRVTLWQLEKLGEGF